MIKFSICIATYKRPELLKKLIDSLLIQKNIELSEVEIIIVDNDSSKSAQTVVNKYIGKHACEVYYYMQPEKNISLTRNLALDKIKGDYVFFIDDDEYADEYWMGYLIDTIVKYNADGVFGRIVSYFDKETPEWIRGCMVFHKSFNLTGQKPANMSTANCILKSSLFTQKGYRFNLDYGITGGSDYQLFLKIEQDGYKLISCDKAVTYDFIPKTRAHIFWLIKRVARTGNNFSRTQIEQSEGFKKIIVSIREVLKGSIQGIIALVLSLIFLWNPTKSLNWFLKSISNFYKIFAAFGYYVQEYKL